MILFDQIKQKLVLLQFHFALAVYRLDKPGYCVPARVISRADMQFPNMLFCTTLKVYSSLSARRFFN